MIGGLGRHRDPADERDYTWRATVIPTEATVPLRFTLGAVGPVLDQGDTPQCVCYTSASVKLHEEWRDHLHYYAFDPGWLYTQCKKIDGIPGDGTIYRAALDVMLKTGMRAVVSGQERFYKIGSYVRCTSIQQIKEAIFIGDGVVGLGLDIDMSWAGPHVSDGIIDPPTNDPIGGHEISAVGWDDSVAGGSFRIKNSWGPTWGDNGFAYLPYRHLSAYPDWDAWKALDALPPLI
jgi:hypothetical protein